MAEALNLKNIKDTLLQHSDEIVRQVNMGIEELKQEAHLFLNQLNNIYFIAGQTSNKGKNNEIMRLWNIYRDAETAQALALAQHNFAFALDKFLGRSIILTYVDKDGKILLYTEEQERDILNAVSKNVGRQNFKQSEWIKAANQQNLPEDKKIFFKGEEDLQEAINKEIQDKQLIYQTALKRYQESKKNKNEKYRKKYYWIKNYSTRQYADSQFTIGEMAEGYVTAIIEKGLSSPIGEDVEVPLEELYSNYIKGKKDSLGAIVSGDVIIEEGRLSLAVKTRYASTAKIGQYIVAAYQIITQEKITKEQISEVWLSNLPNINNLVKTIEEIAGKTFEQHLMEKLETTNLNIIL